MFLIPQADETERLQSGLHSEKKAKNDNSDDGNIDDIRENLSSLSFVVKDQSFTFSCVDSERCEAASTVFHSKSESSLIRIEEERRQALSNGGNPDIVHQHHNRTWHETPLKVDELVDTVGVVLGSYLNQTTPEEGSNCGHDDTGSSIQRRSEIGNLEAYRNDSTSEEFPLTTVTGDQSFCTSLPVQTTAQISTPPNLLPSGLPEAVSSLTLNDHYDPSGLQPERVYSTPLRLDADSAEQGNFSKGRFVHSALEPVVSPAETKRQANMSKEVYESKDNSYKTLKSPSQSQTPCRTSQCFSMANIYQANAFSLPNASLLQFRQAEDSMLKQPIAPVAFAPAKLIYGQNSQVTKNGSSDIDKSVGSISNTETPLLKYTDPRLFYDHNSQMASLNVSGNATQQGPPPISLASGNGSLDSGSATGQKINSNSEPKPGNVQQSGNATPLGSFGMSFNVATAPNFTNQTYQPVIWGPIHPQAMYTGVPGVPVTGPFNTSFTQPFVGGPVPPMIDVSTLPPALLQTYYQIQLAQLMGQAWWQESCVQQTKDSCKVATQNENQRESCGDNQTQAAPTAGKE